MTKTRRHPQIPAHHAQHYFAPGQVEHHKRRHVRSLARWFGRALALLCLAVVVAAGMSVLQRGGA